MALFAIVLASVGCRQQPQATNQLLAGRTMGTSYSVTVAPSDEWSLPELNRRVERELDLVNRQMSTYRQDSELSQFNAEGQPGAWFPVSRETAQVVQQALEISRKTGGAFDVTVGPLVNLWGFGPDGRPEEIPEADEISAVRQTVGYEHLEAQLDPPALRKAVPGLYVDLSAIAKGHGVDRIAGLLDELGIAAYFVEIGGEIRVRGSRPDGHSWRAGIERPSDGERAVAGILEIRDQALATSGNYRNFYEFGGQRFSHTIDPRTGYPVESDLLSASVVASDCALADAVATSMMCLGTEAGMKLANQEGWAVLLITEQDDELKFLASDAFESSFPEFQSLDLESVEASEASPRT